MSRRSQSMDDEVEKEEGNIHPGALAIDRGFNTEWQSQKCESKNPQKKSHTRLTEREATKKRKLRSNDNIERESLVIIMRLWEEGRVPNRKRSYVR
eukprot:scaffold1395_cov66-Cylindrotheca_fusiformis.AAC.1